MFRLIPGVLALGLMTVPTAGSGDPREVFVNMAHEATECAAYFILVSAGMEHAGDSSEANTFESLAENTFQWAVALGERAGQLPATAEATLRMSLKQHREAIADNFSNIAILNERYASLCTTVVRDPDKRTKYWVESLPLRR